MSHFITTFYEGKQGLNKGLPTGIPNLDLAINGLQQKVSIGLAAAPKVGKTTFCDFAFVINPYLYCLATNQLENLHIFYWSYEIDRVSKEFKFAAFFMAHDYKVYNYDYRGVTYTMDQDYLMGKKLHRDERTGELEQIPITFEHEEMLKQIYNNRIIPLFGEFDEDGNQTKEGVITFIEEPDNPTGMYKMLMKYADENGEFKHTDYTTYDDNGKPIKKKRIIGYKAKNPRRYTICITDHIRKLKIERNFTLKQNIDKWLEYSTFIRNICRFTFINIVHSGRQLANMDRIKYNGNYLYPTADDTKDSGNVAEESTILMTLFNPKDEKYGLEKHFDYELKNFPFYRSLHITESRYTESPTHLFLNMYGGINTFEPLR